MRRPLVRALQGLALSVGSPLGWLILQSFSGADPWLELSRNGGVYLYMLAGTAIAFGGFGFYVGSQEELYLENSLHDELTGLHNARYFRRQLAEEHAFSVRHRRPLALLIGDIDFFKRVNDRFGHGAGNEVLAGIGSAMLALRRRGDTVARIGGEEFAWILPETELAEAVKVAERLRAAIASLRFGFSQSPLVVTMSIGAVVSPPGGAADGGRASPRRRCRDVSREAGGPQPDCDRGSLRAAAADGGASDLTASVDSH